MSDSLSGVPSPASVANVTIFNKKEKETKRKKMLLLQNTILKN